MFESIMKFLGPILQSVLSGAANMGVQKLMSPSPQKPRMQGAGQGGYVPGAPPGVAGSGTTNNPTGSMNFSGGYTGGAPTQGPAGLPSSGFQTIGSPATDQSKLRRGLQDTGFSAI